MEDKDFFQAWKRQLNRLVEAEFEVSLDDLPDLPFMAWYEKGWEATRAFLEIKEEIRSMIY